MREREFDVAVEAVRLAAVLAQNVRRELVTEDTLTKKDKSPVTIADLGVQAVISDCLQGAFPADLLVAEEDAHALRDPANGEMLRRVREHVARVRPGLAEVAMLDAIDHGRHGGGASGRFWVMDPIDGTKGFIRHDQYALALGLIEDGEVVLGVLGCPSLPDGHMGATDGAGVLLAARRGHGAVAGRLDARTLHAIRVSDVDDPAQAVICQSVESGHTSHGLAGRIATRLGVTRPSLHLDSQCKYATVARGEATLYMRLPSKGSTYEEMIWDHAAGWVIVQEAGGRVTDTNGKPLNFALGRTLRENSGVIATNGRIHDAVIEALQAERG